jgi:hypothetical protein
MYEIVATAPVQVFCINNFDNAIELVAVKTYHSVMMGATGD